jgi:cytochrome c oxidase cbb3-type subunit III
VVAEKTPENRVKPRERQYPDPKAKLQKEVAKTGHSWDGIEEYDNPMPRWWLWTFYATIAWAVVYMILYPAWPMVTRRRRASWAIRHAVGGHGRHPAVRRARNQIWFDRLVETDLEEIRADPRPAELRRQCRRPRSSAQCSQCHGAGAGRAGLGLPSLLDDQWLWGGTIEDIHETVRYGIRNDDYPDARWSEMPAFGRDGLLDEEEIDQVVHYVLQMSGQAHDEALAAPGEEIYLDNCAACHGDGGEGDPFVGAPALNNQIWLYGGSYEAIWHSVYIRASA